MSVSTKDAWTIKKKLAIVELAINFVCKLKPKSKYLDVSCKNL